ncbi:organic cation transporter protein [Parasteatoda tepidariorum]|uniref:organic cation transporter protein n=1 Tax=Parasteatoda tepidariorum TaxID=114398 RepID=UPI0039BC617D
MRDSGTMITEITGSFGRWQKLIFGSVFYISVIGVWQNLSITFLAPNVPFRCVNSTEECVTANDTMPCSEWIYDNSETIVSQWDLVCDREWLISLAKSIYMVGFLISVITFGQISDCNLKKIFIAVMEVIGERDREIVGIGVQLGWSVGFASLAGVAYLFRHWFWFQLAMAIPILPIALAFFVLPESPRWLLMQGKVEKLDRILRRAAKMNRKEYKLKITDFDHFQSHSLEKQKSLLDLFKTPRLRSRILCMFYLWMVNSFMYYAMSYNTNDLAGDPYINFTLAGVLEFPSYALLFWGVKKLGRRPTFVGFMIGGGIACILMAIEIPSMPWVRTSLAMAGKFCVTSSFGLLYLYTTEIFPTVVRNVAIGSSSMMARIGSIMAPFVKELGRATYPWVPDVVHGLLAISGGLLVFLLPETKGKSIPDTLQEGEQYELQVGVNQVPEVKH